MSLNRVYLLIKMFNKMGHCVYLYSPDVDECAISADPLCHAHAVCSNTEGSYTCTCDPGHHLDAWGVCVGKIACVECVVVSRSERSRLRVLSQLAVTHNINITIFILSDTFRFHFGSKCFDCDILL